MGAMRRCQHEAVPKKPSREIQSAASPQFADLQGDFDEMQGEPIQFLAESHCAVRSSKDSSLSKDQGGASGIAGKSRVAKGPDAGITDRPGQAGARACPGRDALEEIDHLFLVVREAVAFGPSPFPARISSRSNSAKPRLIALNFRQTIDTSAQSKEAWPLQAAPVMARAMVERLAYVTSRQTYPPGTTVTVCRSPWYSRTSTVPGLRRLGASAPGLPPRAKPPEALRCPDQDRRRPAPGCASRGTAPRGPC